MTLATKMTLALLQDLLLAQSWGCSRRTSLRYVALAQCELATALDSVELQRMVELAASCQHPKKGQTNSSKRV